MDQELKTVIDPMFRDFLGKLTDEEYQALEASLWNEGCRDAIIVWAQADGETAIVLDGHNRIEICQRRGIPYDTTVVTSSLIGDRDQAIDWIIKNQRGRRNLTKEQLEYRIGRLFATVKGTPGGDRESEEHKALVQRDPMLFTGSTAERIGKQFGVSASTVKRYGKYADKVDAIAAEHGPGAKAEILAGRKRVEDFAPPPADAPAEAAPDTLSVEQLRTMDDADHVKYLASNAVILPEQDCGARPGPVHIASAASENLADPDAAAAFADSLSYAVCELERHAAALPSMAARERPAPEKCAELHERLKRLVGVLRDFTQTLLEEKE